MRDQEGDGDRNFRFQKVLGPQRSLLLLLLCDIDVLGIISLINDLR